MKRRLFNNLSLLLAVLMCTCLIAGTAVAQRGFDGDTANPGDWDDPNNWTGNTLPSAADGLIDVGVDPGAVAGALLNATANISGPLTTDTIGELRVGRLNNAVGVVNQSGGTLNSGGWAFIGVDGDPNNPSTGTYNLSNDAVWNNLGGPILTGTGGTPHAAGLENVGTISVADTAQLNADALGVGNNDNNIGIVNQSGGSVAVSNWMNIGDTGGATGEYNMTGGSLSFGELSVGQNSGASGTLNVSGSSAISGGNARLGRDDGTGVLNVNGSGVNFDVAQLSLAGNDGGFSNNSSGTVNFFSDGGGVSVLDVVGNVTLNNAQGGTNGIANLSVDLSGGDPGGAILLVDVGGSLTGEFTGLPEGAAVPGSNGRTITYTFGDGNNIALVPEPMTCMLLVVGVGASLWTRRRNSSF